MLTYQDFEKISDRGKAAFVSQLIQDHLSSEPVKWAKDADEYDRQRNIGIREINRNLDEMAHLCQSQVTSGRNEICSNFFARLNTQRVEYSLGNGLEFNDDGIKERLGAQIDKRVKDAAYYALIHGSSFGFWAYDHIEVFKLTEFAPLWDEKTGTLRAGVRYWRLSPEKPMQAVLYEEDGYTKYSAKTGTALEEIQPKKPYSAQISYTEAGGDDEVICVNNYSALPVVPLWGSRLHQSTLVGMRAGIDAYDLVLSGFANDLQDCAQIYWITENYGGMEQKDLQAFMRRLFTYHIANVDTINQGKVQPYTQEIPYQAREQLLSSLRSQIYEDFGGLDVHTVSAGATNDHIDAAYQAVDEQADDFEYQIIEFVQQLLALQGVNKEAATPLFKRNRLSNQSEQTDMVIAATTAGIIDADAALNHIPWITPDEIEDILKRKSAEDLNRFNGGQEQSPSEDIEQEGDNGEADRGRTGAVE